MMVTDVTPLDSSSDNNSPIVVSSSSHKVTVLFTEQRQKTQYRMSGMYESHTGRLELKYDDVVHAGSGSRHTWRPCDAVGYVSRDLSTFTGESRCHESETHGGMLATCPYAGGGEFVLRHDRTKFSVTGAGDEGVNGVYSSVPLDHDIFKLETYDGSPVFKQSSCEHPLAEDCMDNVLINRKVGSQSFWIIADLEELERHKEDDVENNIYELQEVFETIKYSVWSADVTPPP